MGETSFYVSVKGAMLASKYVNGIENCSLCTNKKDPENGKEWRKTIVLDGKDTPCYFQSLKVSLISAE